MEKKIVENLLYKELSYQVHGAAIEVRKDFGPGHKEKLYQDAFAKELERKNVAFQKEPAIKIYAPKDGKYIGLYRPDFIVDEKIIVETKAERFVRQDEIKRVYDYLRNSRYELAYLINFVSLRLFVKRIIFTNDRKPFINPPINTNVKLNYAKKVLVSIGLLLVLFSGVSADAASLYFTVPRDVVFVGDDFEVSLAVDPEGEAINALEGKIILPKNTLLRSVQTGDSVVGLWVEGPEGKDGVVSFSGIIPGGFDGIRKPFTLANAPGKVFSLAVRAHAPGAAVFSLNDVLVLAHDGKGTPLAVVSKSATIAILRDESGENEKEKTAEIKKDTFSPEPFSPLVTRDSALFDGKWALIFAADDQESGIAQYEIYESARRYRPRDLEREDILWTRALSPYLLADQERKSYVYVKAVDNEGNARIARVSPQTITALLVDKLIPPLSAAGIIITLLLIVFFKKKYSTKRR